MSNNEELELITADPEGIFQEAKNLYKELSGNEVVPASEESYLLGTISALIGNIKAEMNRVALENYLPYAKNMRLDLKGAIYGSRGERLGANAARTTMRCHISTTIERNVVIPSGTRFLYKTYIFTTEDEYTINQGELFVDIPVVCETTGDIGTILKGEITEIIDRYDYFESCENITDVSGGRDDEDDESYRKRIREIPESFTSAGSEGAYKFWTKKASSLVTDVIIKSPTPNVLDIYVCNNQAIIQTEEKQKIKEYLEQEDIKALNDKITIKDPEIHNYNIKIKYYLYKNARNSKELIEKNLQETLKNYTTNLKIGDSINIQDLIGICKSNSDIKKIEIEEPAEYEATDITICSCDEISLIFMGSEEK